MFNIVNVNRLERYRNVCLTATSEKSANKSSSSSHQPGNHDVFTGYDKNSQGKVEMNVAEVFCLMLSSEAVAVKRNPLN